MMTTEEKKPASSGSGDFEVGYGKPPKSNQFKPGQSGNPRGRSKGTRNLKTDLAEELGETILVQEGGEPRKLSKQRAVVKTLVNRTLKGDVRAANSVISMMMRLLDTGEGSEADETDDLKPDELEVLEAYNRRLVESTTAEPACTASDAREKNK